MTESQHFDAPTVDPEFAKERAQIIEWRRTRACDADHVDQALHRFIVDKYAKDQISLPNVCSLLVYASEKLDFGTLYDDLFKVYSMNERPFLMKNNYVTPTDHWAYNVDLMMDMTVGIPRDKLFDEVAPYLGAVEPEQTTHERAIRRETELLRVKDAANKRLSTERLIEDLGDDYDFTEILAEGRQRLEPAFFPRSDGICLLYPGMIHSFHGESESGKSLIGQIEAVRLIMAGQDVLFVDFESDADSVAQRLLDLGATSQSILDHFDYRRPEISPTHDHEMKAWTNMLKNSYVLAIVDGVTDGLGIFGYSTKDNDDITAWMNKVPKAIAKKTGAAVVIIDHVTKSAETRGRFAIGGQAKMASLTGAAYTIEVKQPLGIGMCGEIIMRLGKDRPGTLRSRCGEFRAGDRTQEAARVIVDSTGDTMIVTIEPPSTEEEDTDAQDISRQAMLFGMMEQISKIVEKNADITTSVLRAQVRGKNTNYSDAVDELRRQGFLSVVISGRSKFHRSLKPYRIITTASDVTQTGMTADIEPYYDPDSDDTGRMP